MTSPEDRTARRRAARESVRAARSTSVRPTPWPLPALARAVRTLADPLHEAVLGLLGLGLLAAVTAGAHLAWRRAPGLTAAVAVLAVVALVSAVVVAVRAHRSGRRTRSRGVAVGVLVVVGILAGLALTAV